HEDEAFSEELSGKRSADCGLRVYLYGDRDEALADLARFYEPLRLVWGLQQEGGSRAALARSALEGDAGALGALADALEEAGDPRGPEVRLLHVGDPPEVERAPAWTVTPEGAVYGAALTPDGTTVATAVSLPGVRLAAVADGADRGQWPTTFDVTCVA